MPWEKEYEHWRDMGHTWGPGVDDTIPLSPEEEEKQEREYAAFQQKLKDYSVPARREYAEAGKELEKSLPDRSDIIHGRAPFHWREDHSTKEIELCQKAAESLGYSLEPCSQYQNPGNTFSIKVERYGYLSERGGNIHPYVVSGVKNIEDCLQLVADFAAIGADPTTRYGKSFCYSTKNTGELRWELERRYGRREFTPDVSEHRKAPLDEQIRSAASRVSEQCPDPVSKEKNPPER